MKRLIKTVYVLFCIVSITSCLSVKSMRSQIKTRNPEVQEVGILKEWHQSRYLALDIIFKDGRRLLLTRVGPYNLRSSFFIKRVGDYFITYFVLEQGCYPVPENMAFARLFGQAIGIPLRTVHDVIQNYDAIYAYVLKSADLEEIRERTVDEYVKFKYKNAEYTIGKSAWSDYYYDGRKPQY